MRPRRILIFDEDGFVRVCSALLESEGYEAQIVTSPEGLPSALNSRGLGLIITSYPFSTPLFKAIKKRDIPTIILSDDFDENVVTLLKDRDNSYCMMKPLDYGKFRSLVRRVMSGASNPVAGSHFVA